MGPLTAAGHGGFNGGHIQAVSHTAARPVFNASRVGSPLGGVGTARLGD
jgi:hypothetical protein